MPEFEDFITAARSQEASARLTARLTRGCWPCGGDRHDPVAAEWLRRWHARSVVPTAAGCGCAAGRCEVCN